MDLPAAVGKILVVRPAGFVDLLAVVSPSTTASRRSG